MVLQVILTHYFNYCAILNVIMRNRSLYMGHNPASTNEHNDNIVGSGPWLTDTTHGPNLNETIYRDTA